MSFAICYIISSAQSDIIRLESRHSNPRRAARIPSADGVYNTYMRNQVRLLTIYDHPHILDEAVDKLRGFAPR